MDKDLGLRCDQTIKLATPDSRAAYPDPLRRVGYVDAKTGKRYDFLTNHFDLPAIVIADLYRCRWQVELFFKWIQVRITTSSSQIEPGQSATIQVSVSGGLPPYTYASLEPSLSLSSTSYKIVQGQLTPDESTTYLVEVTDGQGTIQRAQVDLFVAPPGVDPLPPTPPRPPVPPVVPPTPPKASEFSAQSPLAQALTELWEKGRKQKVDSIQKIRIRFFESTPAFNVYRALATLRVGWVF